MGRLRTDLALADPRRAGGGGCRVLAARRRGLRRTAEVDRARLDARATHARGQHITQQLAKNLYLSPSRNPLRKFRELIIARRLEAELTKRRILELYLNVIEWGDGIYGIEAASQAYFHHPAATLGPSEAALLAGAIVNPRLLTAQKPTPRLLRRQQMILKRMGESTAPAPPANDEPPAREALAPDPSLP